MKLIEIASIADLTQFLTERKFVPQGADKYKIDSSHYIEVKILDSLTSEVIIAEYRGYKNKYQDTPYQLLVEKKFTKFVIQRDNGKPIRVTYTKNKQYDPNTEKNFLKRIDGLNFENSEYNQGFAELFEIRISITERGAINFLADCMTAIQKEMSDLSDDNYTRLEEVTGFLWARKLDEKTYKDPEQSKKLQYDAKRAASYIIVNQFLFYHLLQYHQPDKFPRPLQPNEEIVDPSKFNDYFNEVRQASSEGDYLAVFGADLLSLLPKTKKVVSAINTAIQMIMDSDIEQVTQDVLGKIFHNMIPSEIRKRIAAYYTGSAPAQLLARVSIDRPEAIVIDLTCGSGTLLVESYHIKDELYQESKTKLKPEKKHNKILKELYGNDISVFAAHLASINLARQNLDVFTDAVNISIGDGLSIIPSERISRISAVLPKIGENYQMDHYFQKKTIKKFQGYTLDGEDQWIQYPFADCILMNPPFSKEKGMDPSTAQHIRKLMKDYGLEDLIDRKMGLHGYFIFHADRFLNDNGVIAMVLPASTFTTDYTSELLFFLKKKNYSIEYIFEILSKRSAFSEDCAFKEFMVVFRKGSLKADSKTKVVSIKDEFLLENTQEIAQTLKSSDISETPFYYLKIIPTEQIYASSKWTELFSTEKTSIDPYLQSDLLEKIEGNTSKIDVVCGYNGTYSEWLMLPSDDWDIKKIDDDFFELSYVGDPKVMVQEPKKCMFPSKYLVESIRKTGDANNLILTPNCYILDLPFEPELDNELLDFCKIYLDWATKDILAKSDKDKENGHKRVDLITKASFKLNKKSQKVIKDVPWYSFAHYRNCTEKKGEFFHVEKYRPKLRRSLAPLSKKTISLSMNFGNIIYNPNNEFYAAWFNSALYYYQIFGKQQVISKGYYKMKNQDFAQVLIPKFYYFQRPENQILLSEIIESFRNFAKIPQEQIPFLPDQFSTKFKPRYSLDRAWLKSLGVKDIEIPIILAELYNWLKNYMETR